MTQFKADEPNPLEPLRVTADDAQTFVPQEFDWLVYADATAAGLAVLIPLPVVDWLMEQSFRRRMAGVIARRNGRRLTPAIRRELNQSSGSLLAGCLAWPLRFVLYLLKNIYRTLVFVLSVKDATDNLSYYWHRAFLLDYMARRGDLDSLERAHIGGRALNQVLGSLTTSPLTGLARQIIERGRLTLRALFRWRRRREEPSAVAESRAELAARWSTLRTYFAGVAERYNEAYAAIEAQVQMV